MSHRALLPQKPLKLAYEQKVSRVEILNHRFYLLSRKPRGFEKLMEEDILFCEHSNKTLNVQEFREGSVEV